MNYAKACREATEAQGLSAFAATDGWTVEQTGGFTMVAVRHLADNTVWCVTMDGPEDTPYFAVHVPHTVWEEQTDGPYLDECYLTLQDALSL